MKPPAKGADFLYHRDTIWMLETVINQDFNLAELTTETEIFMHYYRLEEETIQYLFRQWLKWPERADTMRVQPLRVHRGKDTRDSWSGATWRTAVFALRQVTGSAHTSKMRYSEDKMTQCSRGAAACRHCQHELRNCHLAVSVKQWNDGNLHSSGRFWVKSWPDLTCSPPLKVINIHSVAIRLIWANPFVIKSRFWTRFCRFQLSNVWYMDHVNIGIWKIEFPQQFCDTQRYHHSHPYWHRTVHLILWRMFSLHSLPTRPCCTTTSKPHAAAPKAKGWLEGHY